MSERVMLQGLKREKELEIEKLYIKASALQANLHTQTHPLLTSVIDLMVDQITSQARDLERLVYKIRGLAREIEALKKELGEDNGD